MFHSESTFSVIAKTHHFFLSANENSMNEESVEIEFFDFSNTNRFFNCCCDLFCCFCVNTSKGTECIVSMHSSYQSCRCIESLDGIFNFLCVRFYSDQRLSGGFFQDNRISVWCWILHSVLFNDFELILFVCQDIRVDLDSHEISWIRIIVSLRADRL